MRKALPSFSQLVLRLSFHHFIDWVVKAFILKNERMYLLVEFITLHLHVWLGESYLYLWLVYLPCIYLHAR